MKDVAYPYLPPGRTFLYVAESDPFMQEARTYALTHSRDMTVQTGSVLVKDGRIIGRGANGSDYHLEQPCERVRLGVPTGEQYDLCEGCHPKHHSEVRAIENSSEDPFGSDLYLWGHWWACEPCWRAIQDAGVDRVYLMEGSERLFNKQHPENILGTSTP